jgi:hypothetical protein
VVDFLRRAGRSKQTSKKPKKFVFAVPRVLGDVSLGIASSLAPVSGKRVSKPANAAGVGGGAVARVLFNLVSLEAVTP